MFSFLCIKFSLTNIYWCWSFCCLFSLTFDIKTDYFIFYFILFHLLVYMPTTSHLLRTSESYDWWELNSSRVPIRSRSKMVLHGQGIKSLRLIVWILLLGWIKNKRRKQIKNKYKNKKGQARKEIKRELILQSIWTRLYSQGIRRGYIYM